MVAAHHRDRYATTPANAKATMLLKEPVAAEAAARESDLVAAARTSSVLVVTAAQAACTWIHSHHLAVAAG